MSTKFLTQCFLLPIIAWSTISILSAQPGEERKRFEFNYLGDSHYSQYGFTDQLFPYRGLDSWMEFKTSYWLESNKRLAPYASLLVSHTQLLNQPDTISLFNWQRFIQGTLGVQFYPFYDKYDTGYRPWFGLRLFALGGIRHYYDKDASQNIFTDYEWWDLQVGADYYYDNLFEEERLTLIAWTNASYRLTNFSHKGLREFIWTGNLKLGMKMRQGRSLFLPYVTADWTYAKACPCRFWENYLRSGAGVKLYPKAFRSRNRDDLAIEILRRLNIYAEVLYNVKWLGDSPENEISNYDWRIGISYSTSGFFRRENR